MHQDQKFLNIHFDEFKNLPHGITLLGMSGVGKTLLSSSLHKSANWFHYSADYRIGTRYLAEHILDNIKFKIMRMRDPFVASLLRSDSIYINHNITVNNLQPVSTFLGMFGDESMGGLDKETFLSRQALYHRAEVESMKEVGHFIEKSWEIYNCENFINDASGSLCEICDIENSNDPVITALRNSSLILYIEPDKTYEQEIKIRAQKFPKPLFYNSEFILPYLNEKPDNGKGVDPIKFVQSLFPNLVEFRRPQYKSIADKYGFTVKVKDLFKFNTPHETTPSAELFLRLIYEAAVNAAKTSKKAAINFNNYIKICIDRQNSRK